MIDEVYGSHIPVLESLFTPEMVAIEFGGGEYSTGTLLRCKWLYTLENNSEWHEKLRSRYSATNWMLCYADAKQMGWAAREWKFDAAFVDCAPDKWRGPIGNILFARGCPLIVFHDWEAQQNCRYKQMNRPKEYRLAIFRHVRSGVQTAVFTKHKLSLKVPDHDRMYGRYAIGSRSHRSGPAG